MHDTLIQERLDLCTPEYREFIESELVTVISTSFAEYYKFTPKQTTALENALTLLLLFILNKEQFTDFVSLECSLDSAESQSLYHGVVLALPESIRAAFLHVTDQLEAKDTHVSATTLQEEIAATEQAFEALPAFRTMTPLVPTTETVYTSTQAAILHEGKMPATPPATPEATNASPRWDTAS